MHERSNTLRKRVNELSEKLDRNQMEYVLPILKDVDQLGKKWAENNTLSPTEYLETIESVFDIFITTLKQANEDAMKIIKDGGMELERRRKIEEEFEMSNDQKTKLFSILEEYED